MAPRLKRLFDQEQGVEDNGFRQRHAEHGQRDDLAESPGISSHSFGGFHTNKADANCRPEAGQTDVDAAAQFPQHRCYHNVFLYCCFVVAQRLPRLNTVEPSKFLSVPRLCDVLLRVCKSRR